MAKTKTKAPAKKTKTRRADPDVVAKRRAARALNRLFAEGGGSAPKVDHRTQKRLDRLVAKLTAGNAGEPLKALDALQCAHELLTNGYTYTELRRLKPKVPKFPKHTDGVAEAIATMQGLYNFHPQAWKLLGVDIRALLAVHTD